MLSKKMGIPPQNGKVTGSMMIHWHGASYLFFPDVDPIFQWHCTGQTGQSWLVFNSGRWPYFSTKKGATKKIKKKNFMDFLVMALFDHGMCPNWMLEWTQPMVDCRRWSVPKVDLRNFLGPHPPLVPDELWGSARLPEAIDANFTEILVFDLEGNKRYRPHPFKDLVNVTVLRRFDSGMIFFWHVPECSPFLENRTDKEVVTQYILVLNIFNIVCLLNLFSFVWEFICLLNNLNNIRNWILGFFLEDPGGHFCMDFFFTSGDETDLCSTSASHRSRDPIDFADAMLSAAGGNGVHLDCGIWTRWS